MGELVDFERSKAIHLRKHRSTKRGSTPIGRDGISLDTVRDMLQAILMVISDDIERDGKSIQT